MVAYFLERIRRLFPVFYLFLLNGVPVYLCDTRAVVAFDFSHVFPLFGITYI